MDSGDLSEKSSDLEGSIREYAIYFVGMGEGKDREVSLERLLDELPYEETEVMDDLDWLESHGYVESSHDGEVYPVETEGFHSLLEDTVFSDVDPAFYRLGESGSEFVSAVGLDEYERSLKYVFQD